MYLKPDKPFGPSQNTAHTLLDSLLGLVINGAPYILPVGGFVRCHEDQYFSGVEGRTASFGPAIPICRAGAGGQVR